MGQALLALALAGALAVAQERDPVWDDLVRSLGDEFRAAKALRKEPGRRAEADELHRELLARLASMSRELAVPLFHEAFALGSDAERTSDVDERARWLEVAAAAARLANDERSAARASQELAHLLAGAGRESEACAGLESALALTRADALRAYLLQDLAEGYRRLGDHARALEKLEELALLVARDPALASLQRTLDAIRSYVYIGLGLPDRAAEAIHRRLQAAEDPAVAPAEWIQARVAYANWLFAVGQVEELADAASGYLEEDVLRDAPAAQAELGMLLGASECALEIEQPGREPRGAERLARVLAHDLDPRRAAFCRLARAELFLAHGGLDETERELAATRAGLESAGSERLAGSSQEIDLVTLEARLALERRAGPAVLSAARARAAASVEAMLAAWSKAPERAGGVGWLLYPKRRALLGEYARLVIALEGEQRGAELALEQLLEVETLGTLARRERIEAPGLERIRAELLPADPGRERGILVYLPTRGASHVFALDRAGLVHAETAPSFVLERARRDYLAHLIAAARGLADPAQRSWALELERRLAKELAERLLPPRIAARVAAWSEVTLVGTDSLGPVPFEWLPLGAEPHLGVARALDTLPSLPLGVAWAHRARSRTAELDLVLVGGALPSASVAERWPELETITLPAELVEELSGAYAPARVRPLVGAAATRRALAEIDLDSVTVLQFLTHGVLEPERERPLALVLGADGADDGLFRCEDAEAGDAPRLVVLASCRTASGPIRKGDPGSADMGGAWLAAGAQAVLLSHADLALEEAARASRLLHRVLAAGGTPAEGLRAARAELVAEQGPAAPFLGGLLGVVGLGHRPVFEARSEVGDDDAGRRASALSSLAWLCAGLGAGALVGFVLRRRPVRSVPRA